MDAASWALVGGNVLTLATLIYRDWSATRREIRHRAWEVQDRTLLTEKVVAGTAEIVTRVGAVHTELEANTKISTEAFHEANGAKLLLAEEVRRRNALQERAETRDAAAAAAAATHDPGQRPPRRSGDDR